MTAYLRPGDLDEALRLRREHPDFIVIAGCTDVMVGRQNEPDPSNPPGLLDLFGLPELVFVRQDAAAISIGAATTYANLRRQPIIQQQLPSLWTCAGEIGAVQIQERGTLGGNIANASPVGDTLPVLLALNATIEVAGASGRRRIPYDQFCTGYRTTALGADELIVAIEIPAPKPATQQYWRKVGTRHAQSIAKVSVAGAAEIGPDGNVASCRLAMGAVAATPIRLPTVEQTIVGATPDQALANRVKQAVRAAITPIDDVRSSAFYRSLVAGNLAARFVLGLAQ